MGLTALGSTLRRWVVAAIALIAVSAVASDAIRIIELKHRPAAEVAPLIRPLLGPNDALSTTDYRLIVRAQPATVAAIERLVREIDIARRQLTITVRQFQASESDRSSHGVGGEARIGDRGRVRLPKHPRENETVIIGDPDGVQYRGGERRVTDRAEHTQQLRVLDGGSGYLRMGQSIAQVQRVLSLAGDRWVESTEIFERDITTGFDVRPQVRGNRVQLDIAPRIARLSDPRRGIVDFREAATSVDVKLGEWIDLGQILSQGSEINRAILQRDAEQTSGTWRVLLKVD